KYIGGHGTSIGGALIDGGNFDWEKHAARFPGLNQPDPSYHGAVWTQAVKPLGPIAYIIKARVTLLRVPLRMPARSRSTGWSRSIAMDAAGAMPAVDGRKPIRRSSPLTSASRTPPHGTGGAGAPNRSGPTGGAAYGTPFQTCTRPSSTTRPTSRPVAISTSGRPPGMEPG
ncbi:MAG: hypothetical protein REI11_06070, partial [Patulibacter sp.]|nr:hypothetical protein [Patulibacter sp.]